MVYVRLTRRALQYPYVGSRDDPDCRICTWIRRSRLDFASTPPSGKKATQFLILSARPATSASRRREDHAAVAMLDERKQQRRFNVTLRRGVHHMWGFH